MNHLCAPSRALKSAGHIFSGTTDVMDQDLIDKMATVSDQPTCCHSVIQWYAQEDSNPQPSDP
jgi:hypothetical protein